MGKPAALRGKTGLLPSSQLHGRQTTAPRRLVQLQPFHRGPDDAGLMRRCRADDWQDERASGGFFGLVLVTVKEILFFFVFLFPSFSPVLGW